jgi:hypothetical protein
MTTQVALGKGPTMSGSVFRPRAILAYQSVTRALRDRSHQLIPKMSLLNFSAAMVWTKVSFYISLLRLHYSKLSILFCPKWDEIPLSFFLPSSIETLITRISGKNVSHGNAIYLETRRTDISHI